MYEMWTNMHRIERDPWCLGWTHVTITCFNQQLQDQVVQQLINETHEFECQYSTQEMHTMTKVVQTFHDNIKCGP